VGFVFFPKKRREVHSQGGAEKVGFAFGLETWGKLETGKKGKKTKFDSVSKPQLGHKKAPKNC